MIPQKPFLILISLQSAVSAQTWLPQPSLHAESRDQVNERGSLRSPIHLPEQVAWENATIRYNKTEICETTPGVNSYSGFVDLDAESHIFFWFFEARNSPETAPITLWLNGGPGSDSLIGLFNEIGPCFVNPDLSTSLNPSSWSEVSNLLFISQPLGVGFSYANQTGAALDLEQLRGSRMVSTANSDIADGRFKINLDGSAIETSAMAAKATWHVVQTFLASLPTISSKVTSRDFHLWTESYGGHYGPAFFQYFKSQNILVKDGTINGIPLNLKTLGIGNGIIDAETQFPFYPQFAINNTYGIRTLDDDIVSYMERACHMINGCLDQVSRCQQTLNLNRNSVETIAYCTEAANMCRDNVEGPYYSYGNGSMYDIRQPPDAAPYSDFFETFLNLPDTQKALGVDLNFTYQSSSLDVYSAFQQSGDYVYPDFIEDIEELLDGEIRIILTYGDADYIGNWMGGEAVSLRLNYSQSFLFGITPYANLTVDGVQQGIVREFGNLSFAVVFDAGHQVPTYKPEVALEIFRRATGGLDVATGLHAAGSDETVPLPPDAPIGEIR